MVRLRPELIKRGQQRARDVKPDRTAQRHARKLEGVAIAIHE
jgi:hypothetical protein